MMIDALQQYQISVLKPLCENGGYGAVMSEVAKLYKQQDIEKNEGRGANFVVGPCEAGTVSCGCKRPHRCDWCNGCGWLTKHVKSIKDS